MAGVAESRGEHQCERWTNQIFQLITAGLTSSRQSREKKKEILWRPKKNSTFSDQSGILMFYSITGHKRLLPKDPQNAFQSSAKNKRILIKVFSEVNFSKMSFSFCPDNAQDQSHSISAAAAVAEETFQQQHFPSELRRRAFIG